MKRGGLHRQEGENEADSSAKLNATVQRLAINYHKKKKKKREEEAHTLNCAEFFVRSSQRHKCAVAIHVLLFFSSREKKIEFLFSLSFHDF